MPVEAPTPAKTIPNHLPRYGESPKPVLPDLVEKGTTIFVDDGMTLYPGFETGG